MRVKDLMTHHTATCTIHSNLEQVALAMWDGDFGVVPIVDDDQRVIGIITDRDIAMAEALRHLAGSELSVGEVRQGRSAICCRPDDDVGAAIDLMEVNKIRRLPVVDDEGGLRGMLSFADIAAYAGTGDDVSCSSSRLVGALKAIATPHTETGRMVM